MNLTPGVPAADGGRLTCCSVGRPVVQVFDLTRAMRRSGQVGDLSYPGHGRRGGLLELARRGRRAPVGIRRSLAIALGWLAVGFGASELPGAGVPSAPVRVMLLSGDNNHAWRETTPALEAILAEGGRCRVDVVNDVARLGPEAFAACDVVLSNYNTFKEQKPTDAIWRAEVRAAFVARIRQGGGMFIVHAGSSGFYDWREFQLLAMTSWTLGTTRHGLRHAARVEFSPIDHPITRGLPTFWIFDEFWEDLVVQPGATVLATVTPSPEFKGSGRPQPTLFATEFGGGRAVTLLLGHDVAAMRNPAFRTLLVRGAEWAARGTASVAPPAGWPDDRAAAIAIAGVAAAPGQAKAIPKTNR